MLLRGTAFDCSSRGPQFKSGCPLSAHLALWILKVSGNTLVQWWLIIFMILLGSGTFPLSQGHMISSNFILALIYIANGRGYSSAVEHLTADQEVPSSNLGAPCNCISLLWDFVQWRLMPFIRLPFLLIFFCSSENQNSWYFFGVNTKAALSSFNLVNILICWTLFHFLWLKYFFLHFN